MPSAAVRQLLLLDDEDVVNPGLELLQSESVLWLETRDYDESGVLADKSSGGHDAQLGSTSGADTNDPKFLDYVGVQYVYLPGTSGNYVTTPDSAALDITGDIDLRVDAALDDWSSSLQNLIAKGASYRLRIDSSGNLTLAWFDGTSTQSETSSAVVPFSDGERGQVRGVLDVDNGSGAYVVRFFTRSTSSDSWVQLGTALTGASTTSISPDSSALAIGANSGGTTTLAAGEFYGADIYASINATDQRADFDAGLADPESTTLAASTGETWTLNRSATGRKTSVVNRSLMLLGTDDFLEISNTADFNFGPSAPLTAIIVRRRYGSDTIGTLIAKRGSFGPSGTGWSIFDESSTGQTWAEVSDGTDEAEDRGAAYTAGTLEARALRLDRSASELEAFLDGTGTGSPADASLVGDISNILPVRIGASSAATPASFASIEFVAAAVFRSVLTDNEIAQVGEQLARPE